MISKVTVFHRGGAVLWTSDDDGSRKQDDQVTANDTNTAATTNNGTLLAPSSTTTSTPGAGENKSSYIAINKLIQTVLLSDKSASDSMIHDAFTLKWSFANNLNLVFVAVYFSFQKLLYVDDFLETVKNEFMKMFEDSLKEGIMKIAHTDYSKFSVQYKRIQKYYKTQYRSVKKPRKWSETTQGKEHSKYKMQDNNKKNKDKDSNQSEETDEDDAPQNASPSKQFGKKSFGRNTSNGPRAFDKSKRAKSQKNVKKKGKAKGKKQEKEHWSSLDVLNFNKKKVSKQQMDSLNFAVSGEEGEGDNNQPDTVEEEEEVIWRPQGEADLEESSSDESSDDDFSDLLVPNKGNTNKNGTDSATSSKNTSSSSWIWNRFSSLIGGGKTLSEEDIEGVLDDLEKSLSSKNVANVIAKELCESVKAQLIGKEISSLSTIRSVVSTAMSESLQRILRPTRPINILHGIRTAQQEGRPYSIVFIGVNGVGKSTSLSKLIYYLKSRNLSVSVAACDTFRSGAVEQLKTHCRALNVRLFTQGYARDAGAVAVRAIADAKKHKDDVVLIDTAGRMQNNAPLMRSLVSLIQRNKPDLTLFVGEALVGNDGVDQLMEFERALKINGNAHLIDGIILTKFDTVDDKVGAAISMTYKSRKPIVFIGTGQNYSDLKRMHANTLIKKLLQ